MNKRICKIIKLVIVAIIIVSLILSFIVSLDSHHIDSCELEHCSLCTIIHMAQNIVNMTVAIFIFTYTSFLIFFFLARMRVCNQQVRTTSLIFQKVQLNE